MFQFAILKEKEYSKYTIHFEYYRIWHVIVPFLATRYHVTSKRYAPLYSPRYQGIPLIPTNFLSIDQYSCKCKNNL